MQQVIVQIDWYTKFVLTLIAVLLAGILVKVNIISRPAGASEEAKAMPDHTCKFALDGLYAS